MAKPEQGINYQDTTGEGNENKPHGISIGEGSESITNTLQTIGDLMDHNQSVTEDDLATLEATLSTTKIDVGGGVMMTPEEAKNFPDLEHNAKIWEEMSQGNFRNTSQLTRITPEASRYLLDIGGNINLRDLTSAEGLTLPKTVVGSLVLRNLTSAKGLIFPQTVKGNIYLEILTSAEGLTFPKNVGGFLDLGNLTSAKGLVFPQTVGGTLYLSSLTSVKGLTLPQTVGGDIYLFNLPPFEIEALKKQRPDLAEKIKISR